MAVSHLYIHIPFCAKICPYCAFHVVQGGVEKQKAFSDALVQEITQARKDHEWQLATIYWGGGTPSLLSPPLFKQIASALPPHQDAEFTLEANPATVTPEKAKAWKAAGVNRISLGAQSFDPEYLKILGRQHQPEDIAETMNMLRGEGFGNISIDLMFALPNQPLTTWQHTVEAALVCRPDHLSAYALTYEEDTPFFKKLKSGVWRTDEANEIAMFEWTRERLSAAGLDGYEISNFAIPGKESRHNQACWRGADYLGLGPSACSTMGTQRWQNIPDTNAYMERMAKGESIRTQEETISPDVRRREKVMFGLRTREGVPMDLLDPDRDRVPSLEQNGLVHTEKDRLILTARGRLVADSVAEIFV